MTKHAPLKLDKPVVFVGLMGSGKSTVGRRLASHLGIPFSDSDTEIEIAAGCSIPDIFEVYGEAAFRDVEQRVIERLLSEGPQVLATGGGAFMQAASRQLILDQATSVWLRAELDVLVERTGRNNKRPLLNNANPRKILAELLDKRNPTYALADITVNTTDEGLNATVQKVYNALVDKTQHEKRGSQEKP